MNGCARVVYTNFHLLFRTFFGSKKSVVNSLLFRFGIARCTCIAVATSMPLEAYKFNDFSELRLRNENFDLVVYSVYVFT